MSEPEKNHKFFRISFSISNAIIWRHRTIYLPDRWLAPYANEKREERTTAALLSQCIVNETIHY